MKFLKNQEKTENQRDKRNNMLEEAVTVRRTFRSIGIKLTTSNNIMVEIRLATIKTTCSMTKRHSSRLQICRNLFKTIKCRAGEVKAVSGPELIA